MNNNPISLRSGCCLDSQGRERCEVNNKVAYDNENQAAWAVQESRFYIKTDLRVYQDDTCGHWHLTSNE